LNDKETSKPSKLNTLAAGIAGGIIIPVAVYFILYFSKLQDVRQTIFSQHLVVSNIIPVVISHCVLPNLILFFILNSLNWMKAAKGVLFTTVVFTVLIFLIKLIFRFL
jgi:hypothetical protein